MKLPKKATLVLAEREFKMKSYSVTIFGLSVDVMPNGNTYVSIRAALSKKDWKDVFFDSIEYDFFPLIATFIEDGESINGSPISIHNMPFNTTFSSVVDGEVKPFHIPSECEYGDDLALIEIYGSAESCFSIPLIRDLLKEGVCYANS